MQVSSFSSSPQLVTYRHLEPEDIHLVTFLRPSREAYDEFIAQMTEVYQTLTPKNQVRILVDYRESGIPPISYVVTRGLSWSRSLSIHPPARMALVTRPETITRVFRTIIATVRIRNLSTRIFEGDAGYQDAVKWLQE